MTQKPEVYFLHSNPYLDPRGRGRRMTVACVVEDGLMKYGCSFTHDKDATKFDKKKGRFIAERRARTKPVFTESVPDDGRKDSFVETALTIIITHNRKNMNTEKYSRYATQFLRNLTIMKKASAQMLRTLNIENPEEKLINQRIEKVLDKLEKVSSKKEKANLLRSLFGLKSVEQPTLQPA